MVGLFVALLCILFNGFFVAVEFAMVKVRATEFRARARTGDRRAVAADEMLQKLERYLAVSQIGITVASLGLGWIGEPAIAKLVNSAWVSATGHEPSRVVHVVVDALALGVLMYVHVIFGEQVPKLMAIQRSEGWVLWSAIPMRVIFFLSRPLLFFLESSQNVILRSLGLRTEASSEGALSEEEIVGILAASAAKSPVGKEKAEMVERVLRFSQRAARHVMVPRVDVVWLSVHTSGADAFEFVRKHEYSRVLLSKGQGLDDVVGYLYVKDLLLGPESMSLPDLTPLCRKALIVAETQSSMDVLREMQRRHVPIAVVVDEWGGSSGIVTMEDLLEEIVGEIRDEFDEEPLKVVETAPHVFQVDGRAMMDELRVTGARVEDADGAEAVGTFLLEKLGRLPRVGDVVELDGATAEVTGVHRRRITHLCVRTHVPKSVPPPAEGSVD